MFVEKIGPFQNTAGQAWQDLQQLVPAISEHNKITGFMSLYKRDHRYIAQVFPWRENPKSCPRTSNMKNLVAASTAALF